MQSEFVKVLFRYHSEVLDETVAETMWAEPVDATNEIYKLNSIPFYGIELAPEDLFFARYDSRAEMLTYQKMIEVGQHSVVLISWTSQTESSEYFVKCLENLDCNWEGMKQSYFAVEVTENVKYDVVVEFLRLFEDSLDYATPCLSANHR